MEIKKLLEGDTLKVAVVGHLDTTTSKELDESLKGDIGSIKDLEFDFKDVDYLSSAALRLLLTYSKALGGKEHVVILNSNSILQEIFSVTAFQTFVSIK